jgi:protein-S-isoprenylcysteine O-methyltransferase Ste14
MVVRHILAIALLPVTVVAVIPLWISRRTHVTLLLGGSARVILVQLVGTALLALGFALFVASLRRFATEGKGTLAPWDPPRAFVVSGPYRFVRNPMISGVIFMLWGEVLVLLSRPHAVWAAFCVVLNLIYIPVFEEPQLRRRFGASYEEYRRNVPRFIPRLTPWHSAS